MKQEGERKELKMPNVTLWEKGYERWWLKVDERKCYFNGVFTAGFTDATQRNMLHNALSDLINAAFEAGRHKGHVERAALEASV